MKFFIFMCCMAYLLTGTSSRLRRTTPMSPALRSDDAEERQVAKFAEIIDFVNSAPNNDDRRRYFRRHGHSKRQDSRRLNEVMAAMYGFAELNEFKEFGEMMREIEEKIRHDVTEDPDDLMEHGVRQKNSNKEKILDKKDTSFDASKYSTAKLKDIETTLEVTNDNPNFTLYTKATVMSNDNATEHVRAQDDVQELITDETINRRSFIDENNEKQNSKSKAKEEHHNRSPAIYKTDKFEKKKQNNKPSRKKDKAQLDKKKADEHNSKETVTKIEDNKEYRSTYLIYSQEKLNEDSIRPKNKPSDKINNTSWDKNENNRTLAESLTLNVNNKAHNNRDYMEKYMEYSIYLQESGNSSKNSKKSYEKADKYDKKMKDKYDTNGEKKSQWIKVDTQKDIKENLRDRNKDKLSIKESDLDKKNDEWISKEKDRIQNDDRLSKKQKDWDSDDRWNKKENYWGKNDDRSSKKEKPHDKDDVRWTIKEKYWNNKKRTDKDFDIMEYEWNKRHEEYDKYKNDAQSDDRFSFSNLKEIYNDHKKGDSGFNKRYHDWTKRGSKWINNHDKANDRNESGNKKSYGSLGQERVVRRDRYKVVDRVDSGNSRDDDY